jgi:hypothetical protein
VTRPRRSRDERRPRQRHHGEAAEGLDAEFPGALARQQRLGLGGLAPPNGPHVDRRRHREREQWVEPEQILRGDDGFGERSCRP